MASETTRAAAEMTVTPIPSLVASPTFAVDRPAGGDYCSVTGEIHSPDEVNSTPSHCLASHHAQL